MCHDCLKFKKKKFAVVISKNNITYMKLSTTHTTQHFSQEIIRKTRIPIAHNKSKNNAFSSTQHIILLLFLVYIYL